MNQNDENCNNDCGSCSENCSSRKTNPSDFLERPHDMSNIKRVVGVISGKGGVGKSLVTSMLAIELRRKNMHVGILDSDITGPSIPKIFGVGNEKPQAVDGGMYPVKSDTGIDIMSINLLLEHENDPVIWRGPIIAGVVKQFWQEVIWENEDVLFVDMPPGTGDVALTVFQSIPVNGLIIVTSPQELVSMIVEKAVNMAKMMKIPILGIIENMSYFKCPDCGKEHEIFGSSKIDEVAKEFGLKVLGKIPIDPKLSALCDEGDLESFEGDWLEGAGNEIKKLLD